MFLGAAEKAEKSAINIRSADSRKVYEKWQAWSYSRISHHKKVCCETAREWLTTTDYGEFGGESMLTGPRWLSRRFVWGASFYPIFWCQAVRRQKLDCGALAAFAHEIYTARGVKSYRVQLVQKFSLETTEQWAQNWRSDGDEKLEWIDGELIYHEGCAVETEPHEIKVWDATAGCWLAPRSEKGYGSVLAIRLSSQIGELPFTWENMKITPNCWQNIA